ncbi:chromosome segregation ATPase [Vibrio alginolyticus]|nr:MULTISPECIES: chromosome segregation ATPase [Vibrio]EGQ9765281.1 chromosome segregation ATPase [Vibrio alginolyticus]EGR1564212.1 chromosome segregation ATPase [Vibrio alginolyticus]EHD0131358.1 chromosome segregation ATPase [Vibrio alginolyticus]ELA8176046.1 chromosome segregation ATPase [Vibrio alginolyticus]MBO0246225.1 chromosome segregation ATPase [Vibrio sp. Vb0592]
MDININTVAATVIRCTSRKHKQILSAFIESHSYSAEELTTLLAGLLPSPIESGVTIASQQTFISELSHALYLHQHPNDADKNQLIDARKLIRIVQANFKKQRKSDEELYCKAVKTNLTGSEYQQLLQTMESYHYKSASRFLRDVITHKLTVKPQQNDAISEYFQQTKRIANVMESLIEQDNPLYDHEIAHQLGDALYELKQNLQLTRNLAIDAHNSQTAELLAMHYLDSNALRALYRNKLEQEDRRDDI